MRCLKPVVPRPAATGADPAFPGASFRTRHQLPDIVQNVSSAAIFEV
ncbi:hypothetical protein MMEU_1220 [Mycobacterium marinum str. Europe]|nr:hypothetical protein MMEU_1220 [Mycobacterium marinum str. Europe]